MNRLAIILLLCTALLPAAGVDVQLTVSLVNPGTPVLTIPNQAQAGVGLPFSLAPGLVNGPATFTASGLPPRLAINPTTGVISGVPTTAGTFQVTVTASNANGVSAWQLAIVVHSGIAGTVQGPFNNYSSGVGVGCGAGRGLASMLILLAFGLGLGQRRR